MNYRDTVTFFTKHIANTLIHVGTLDGRNDASNYATQLICVLDDLRA